ncbi:MAG TPA: PH domain-containing protein [Streptosporangiaceae bacterium]|nr:PH domain-containing protein [Streptosporangiaceae bacterium]
MPSRSGVIPGRGAPASGQEVYRLGTPVVLWWVWLAFAAANIVDLAVQRTQVHTELVIDAIVILVTGFAYALALRPRVVADQAGVTIMNPFRDHHVPWGIIQAVDTSDWVRVHHTRDGSPAAAADAPGKAIECWALYVSARTKRREARPGPPPQRSGGFGGFGRVGGHAQEQPDQNPRMPAEAKYLASLPPARAIASALDTRAEKERARARHAHSGPAGSTPPAAGLPTQPAAPSQVTARWAWFPLAAIAVPALALVITLLT